MRTEICEVMREAYDRGWISTRDGNCSFKDNKNKSILITPSGEKKFSLKESDIIEMKIIESSILMEDKAPSGELDMHWRILRSSDRQISVLHLHPTNIVAAMFAGWSLPSLASLFPEVFRYSKIGDDVPFCAATSRELSLSTFSSLYKDPDNPASIVGQKFHGSCAIGQTPYEAFEHTERLEHICKIALASGVDPKSV